jgi:hypothetical protein
MRCRRMMFPASIWIKSNERAAPHRSAKGPGRLDRDCWRNIAMTVIDPVLVQIAGSDHHHIPRSRAGTGSVGVIAWLQQLRITQPDELDDGQWGTTYAPTAASRTPP